MANGTLFVVAVAVYVEAVPEAVLNAQKSFLAAAKMAAAVARAGRRASAASQGERHLLAHGLAGATLSAAMKIIPQHLPLLSRNGSVGPHWEVAMRCGYVVDRAEHGFGCAKSGLLDRRAQLFKSLTTTEVATALDAIYRRAVSHLLVQI